MNSIDMTAEIREFLILFGNFFKDKDHVPKSALMRQLVMSTMANLTLVMGSINTEAILAKYYKLKADGGEIKHELSR